MIKAPFNFVPLSEKVFFPDWADKISHDIPFEDGVSGVIEYSITSKSPIFVRNGHKKSDRTLQTEDYKSFARLPNGQYYIPASTLKGVVRSVFEIMTASKVGITKNASFGIRELSGSDSDFYRSKIKPEQLRCGWLVLKDDKCFLDDCGLPWRISVEEIDGKLGLGLEEFVKNGDFKKDENRTAKAKYQIAGDCNLHGYFKADNELRNALKVGNRQFVKFSDEGIGGTIVFTGQPGQRKKGKKTNKKGEKQWTGKYFEFVIPDKIVKKEIEISEFLFNDFISIYKNSPDYVSYWKNKLNDGERIPVFFTLDEEDEVDAIGLSYMFKYPAFNSIWSGLRDDDLKLDTMDMTECVFGKTSMGDSLKGRVMFGNAICLDDVTPLPETELILSTPHPSYYPLYLGNGQTWNSNTVRIAGRKRYPVRNNISASTIGTGDMVSVIRPLPSETIFKGSICFHNLRPIELGALVAALTFYKDNTCFHSIGSGKPYGYGKCSIDITSFQLSDNEQNSKSDVDYLNLFRDEIAPYYDDKSITELLAMSRGVPSGKESTFTYMNMSTNRDNNEFLNAKKDYVNGTQLGTYTEILSGTVPKSTFSGNASENLKRKNVEEQLKKEYEKKQEYEKSISEAKKIILSGLYKEATGKLNELSKQVVNRDEIDELLLTIDNLVEKQNQENKEIEANLIIEARDLMSKGHYEDARAIFMQAAQLGFNSYYEEIAKCEKLNGMSKSSIADVVRFTSPKACAKALENRITTTSLTDNDCSVLHESFIKAFSGMKKSDQRKWMDFKNLKAIEDVIGDSNTKKIFSVE